MEALCAIEKPSLASVIFKSRIRREKAFSVYAWSSKTVLNGTLGRSSKQKS